jgi:hypothetical protein
MKAEMEKVKDSNEDESGKQKWGVGEGEGSTESTNRQ